MAHTSRPRLANLHSKLIQIRARLGLTEARMAEALGCRPGLREGDVRAFERGRREPPAEVLLRYARAAGVPLEVLADDDLQLPVRLPRRGTTAGACPYCSSTEGQVKGGRTGTGSQRYLCGNCRRRYTPRPARGGHPERVRREAVRLHLAGDKPSTIARKLGLNSQTVTNWISAYYALVLSAGADVSHLEARAEGEV
jgi:DNA-binding XRE family transcriptional regulator